MGRSAKEHCRPAQPCDGGGLVDFMGAGASIKPVMEAQSSGMAQMANRRGGGSNPDFAPVSMGAGSDAGAMNEQAMAGFGAIAGKLGAKRIEKKKALAEAQKMKTPPGTGGRGGRIR